MGMIIVCTFSYWFSLFTFFVVFRQCCFEVKHDFVRVRLKRLETPSECVGCRSIQLAKTCLTFLDVFCVQFRHVRRWFVLFQRFVCESVRMAFSSKSAWLSTVPLILLQKVHDVSHEWRNLIECFLPFFLFVFFFTFASVAAGTSSSSLILSSTFFPFRLLLVLVLVDAVLLALLLFRLRSFYPLRPRKERDEEVEEALRYSR